MACTSLSSFLPRTALRGLAAFHPLLASPAHSLNPFKMNTYGNRISNPFRMNTYEKTGGGGTPHHRSHSGTRLLLHFHRLPASFFLPRTHSARGHRTLAASFLHRPDPIRRQSLKPFRQPARPTHFHPVHLRRAAQAPRPQAKMHPHVIVRVEARPAPHFIHENSFTPNAVCEGPCRLHANLRANSIPVGLRSNRLDPNPMIPALHLIHQQTQRLIHIAHDRGHSPVVPQIAHRQPARRSRRRNPRPRTFGNVFKLSVPQIVIKQPRLFVLAPQMLLRHFRVHVPVHQQQIRPSIVVHVHKHRSPAEIFRVQPQPRRKRHIVKSSVAIVSIERRGIVRKIRFENV